MVAPESIGLLLKATIRPFLEQCFICECEEFYI